LAEQIVNLTKNITTDSNCKRQFLLNENIFNLYGTISYLLQVVYYLCSKDTIRSKHQYI